MHRLRAYFAIATDPQARRPLLGSLLGRIPESIASVSLVLLIHSKTGSYSSAGTAAAGFAFGSAIAAPVVGRMLDRLGHRDLLAGMAAGFASAVVLLVITVGKVPGGVTVALATAAGLARPPLDAAIRDLWPELVPSARLQAAYSLDATLQELIWIVGPLLLAVLLVFGDPSLPVLACALLCAVGTLAYAGSAIVRSRKPQQRHRAGSRLRSLAFAVLLTAATLYGVAVGILTLALTAFCTKHHAQPAVGVLVAVWGIGSIAGGVAYGTRRWYRAPTVRALGLLGLLAALLVPLAAAPSVPVLALLMLPLGLPLSPWLGTLNEAIQSFVPAGRTAEAFSWVYSLIAIGIAAGNTLSGWMVQDADPGAGFLFAAAAAGSGAGVGALALLVPRLARLTWHEARSV
jgi:MFS family permease